MKKVLERIVMSEGAPLEGDLWLTPSGELKFNDKGTWKNSGASEEEVRAIAAQITDSNAIKVVELDYTGSLPQTGTLTQEQYDKLASDNCLLKIKNRYYYKSYGSPTGIDYLPLIVTPYMNGVKRAYFTASKDNRGWTLNDTVFVEANHQLGLDQVASEIENIKIGNTTYAIPRILIVPGATADGSNAFVPANEHPTFEEALAVFTSGGSVVFDISSGTGASAARIYLRANGAIAQHPLSARQIFAVSSGDSSVVWLDPDYESQNPL